MKYLSLANRLAAMVADWERQDGELADARASLPDDCRDSHQEAAENARIAERRDKLVAEEIKSAIGLSEEAHRQLESIESLIRKRGLSYDYGQNVAANVARLVESLIFKP